MKIYKYELNDVIEMPVGSSVLTARANIDGIFVYAEVPDDEIKMEKHYFETVPTGEKFDSSNARYLITIVVADYYAFHIYEVQKSR